jgi:hypothetical protein
MPLKQSKSPQAFKANVKAEVASRDPHRPAGQPATNARAGTLCRVLAHS